jgi:hypothetical protein
MFWYFKTYIVNNNIDDLKFKLFYINLVFKNITLNNFHKK